MRNTQKKIQFFADTKGILFSKINFSTQNVKNLQCRTADRDTDADMQ